MPSYKLTLSSNREERFKTWLDTKLDRAITQLRERTMRYDDIDKLLRGERPRKDFPYRNASNVVTPVTQIRVDAIVDRVFDAIFGQNPVARMCPVTGRDSQTQIDWHSTAREATDWFNWSARQPTELDTEEVTRSSLLDMCRYGLGVWKVIHHTEYSKSGVYNSDTNTWEADPTQRPIYTGPRWFFISPRDLIWAEGFGTNVQRLPFIGQRTYLTWGQVMSRMRRTPPVYNPNVRAEIRAFFVDRDGNDSRFTEYESGRREPEIYELWCRYDIDEDGLDEELLVDYLPETRTILRAVYAPSRRPFYVARLRERAGTSFDGQGIPDILHSTQEQIDALHNLVIDAGRVSTMHVRLVRSGSSLAATLADDDQEVSPGMELETENPQNDLNVVPLGNPTQAVQTIGLIQYLLQYSQDLIGIGPPHLGDLSSIKRAPASGVQALLSEGSTFTRGVARRYSEPFRAAVMQTFELIRLHGSDQRSFQILGDDGVWVEQLFRLPQDLTSAWAVQIAIADPDSTPEATVQRNLILAQFMLQWLRDVTQAVLAVASPDVPESGKLGLSRLAAVSEEVVRRVIENAKGMQDLSGLLPHLEQLMPAVQQMASQEKQQMLQQQFAQMQALASQGGAA